jgi:hypothetical protein
MVEDPKTTPNNESIVTVFYKGQHPQWNGFDSERREPCNTVQLHSTTCNPCRANPTQALGVLLNK